MFRDLSLRHLLERYYAACHYLKFTDLIRIL